MEKHFVVGITGASGSILAKKLIEFLSKKDIRITIVITENGERVFKHELGIDLESFISSLNFDKINLFSNNDLFAPIASGSVDVDGMIAIPCSMGTMAKIANGLSDNLLTRAAEVCLKEKRKLILIPREAPLSRIHLKNMMSLLDSGASIVPPTVYFYNHPETIDDIVSDIVGRVLASIGIENDLYTKWKSE